MGLSTRMPRLIVQSPEFEGRVFELLTPQVTLGRLPDNDVHIDHGSVSGHHAVLTLDGEDFLVQDLNSTNGTRVNGAKISQHKLTRGDLLQVGNIQLSYESEASGTAQPLPEVASGLDIGNANGSVRPADFRNASPYGRRHQSAAGGAGILVVLSLLLALGGIGFLGYRLFGG